MPIILALDTSSACTSIAIARQDNILAGLVVQSNAERSERLWAETDLLLGEAGLRIRDIDLFAVCVGPGGFTGIRVGMAAAKGMASAAGHPLIGVSSLEATALGSAPGPLGRERFQVCALIKAYRNDVYSQLFEIGPDQSNDYNESINALNEPQISTLEAALDRLSGVNNLILAGEPGLRDPELVQARRPRIDGGGRWLVSGPPRLLAVDVARIAYKKYLNGEAQSPGEVRACYVRPSDAEIKLSQGLVGPGLAGKLVDPDVAK